MFPVVLIIVGIISFIIVVNIIAIRSRIKKLRQVVEQWAEQQGHELISLERASLFKRGPYLFTWKGSMLFRVTLRTASQQKRSGFLAVSSLQQQKVTTAWDDEVEADGTPPDGGIPHLPKLIGLGMFGGVWLGLGLGLLIRPLDFLFLNIWAGGVTGAVAGMAMGFIWHISDHLRRKKMHKSIVLFTAGIALFMMLIGSVIVGIEAKQGDNITHLQQLTIQQLKAVKIYDRDHQLLHEVTDNERLTSFVAACRSVRHPYRQRPGKIHWYRYIRLEGARPLEMKCYSESKHPGDLRCRFVERGEMGEASSGSCRSKGLYQWLMQHFPPRNTP